MSTSPVVYFFHFPEGGVFFPLSWGAHHAYLYFHFPHAAHHCYLSFLVTPYFISFPLSPCFIFSTILRYIFPLSWGALLHFIPTFPVLYIFHYPEVYFPLWWGAHHAYLYVPHLLMRIIAIFHFHFYVPHLLMRIIAIFHFHFPRGIFHFPVVFTTFPVVYNFHYPEVCIIAIFISTFPCFIFFTLGNALFSYAPCELSYSIYPLSRALYFHGPCIFHGSVFFTLYFVFPPPVWAIIPIVLHTLFTVYRFPILFFTVILFVPIVHIRSLWANQMTVLRYTFGIGIWNWNLFRVLSTRR